MKRFWEKLGFRKMDEMEQSIALRAQAYSFRFLAILLFLWSIYESWVVRPNGGSLDQRPSLLLVVSCLLQIAIQQWLSRRAVSGDEEYHAPSPLVMALPVLFWVMFTLIITGALLNGGR